MGWGVLAWALELRLKDMGCGRGHPALGSPATPLRRVSWRHLGADGLGVAGAGEAKTILVIMKVAFFKAPAKQEQDGVCHRTEGVRGDGPVAGSGGAGMPLPPPGFD